jgi:hypothetical protein
VDVLRIEGDPAADEFAFFHRTSRTLVVTDLVFNVRWPRGFVVNVVLFLEGCQGRLAQSPAWRFMIKDRARRASAERFLAPSFETLVVAHGSRHLKRWSENCKPHRSPGRNFRPLTAPTPGRTHVGTIVRATVSQLCAA